MYAIETAYITSILTNINVLFAGCEQISGSAGIMVIFDIKNQAKSLFTTNNADILQPKFSRPLMFLERVNNEQFPFVFYSGYFRKMNK